MLRDRVTNLWLHSKLMTSTVPNLQYTLFGTFSYPYACCEKGKVAYILMYVCNQGYITDTGLHHTCIRPAIQHWPMHAPQCMHPEGVWKLQQFMVIAESCRKMMDACWEGGGCVLIDEVRWSSPQAGTVLARPLPGSSTSKHVTKDRCSFDHRHNKRIKRQIWLRRQLHCDAVTATSYFVAAAKDAAEMLSPSQLILCYLL